MNNIDIFQDYCNRGALASAVELYMLYPNINNHQIECAFHRACENGHLEVAQWLLTIIPTIILSADYNYAFVMACENGHLDVAQWLLTIKPTNNISADEYAFVMACENGHLAVAQWLLTIKPSIILSADYDYAFVMACDNGHLAVAQWLLTIKPPIDISTYNYAFTGACDFGHLEVAQWLLTIKPTINTSADYDNAFRYACKNGHLDVAQWLQSLCPDKYELIVDNNIIVRYCVKRIIPYNKDAITLSIANKEELVCPICYNEEKCIEVQTNCGHNYCTDCIIDYYNMCNGDYKCPYCRQKITYITKIAYIHLL